MDKGSKESDRGASNDIEVYKFGPTRVNEDQGVPIEQSTAPPSRAAPNAGRESGMK